MERVKALVLILVIISFIGGLNWFVTSLRNMALDTDTKDIFNDWIPQKWVNWIYILVFICNLALLVLMLYPKMLTN